MTTTAPPEAVQRARRAAFASGAGSLVEWYDFGLYATAAALVFNTVFFGSGSATVGLLASFGTFAVGYLVRPLGGLVFGHLGDRIGRRPVMMFTLTLMGLTTTAIGLLPTYTSIGVAAPVLLIVLRILQGLGAGAEYAGAVVLSAESSTPDRRGFYASWTASGVWLGGALGAVSLQVALWATGDDFQVWGWRIPFLLSIVMFGVTLYLRRRVHETPAFESAVQSEQTESVPLLSLLKEDKGRLAVGVGTGALAGFAYIPMVWMLSYLTSDLAVAAGLALGISAVVQVCGAAMAPILGLASDRFGRRRVFLVGAGFGVVWAFPMFLLINTGNALLVFLALVVCFVGTIATSYAAQGPLLAELFPPAKRYTGVAFSREVGGALIGGVSPLVATALVASTGSWWPVATWMVVMAVVAFVAVYASRRYRSDEDQNDVDRLTAPAPPAPAVR